MRPKLTTSVMVLATAFCAMQSPGATMTVFRERFFSRDPEMNTQRAAQKTEILKIINAAAEGTSTNRFGQPADGLSFGLFILEPDNVTTTAMYAAAVLRNQTSEPLVYFGTLDRDILAFNAIGAGNLSIERTQAGQYFGGRVLTRDGKPAGREDDDHRIRTLDAGAQIVYEINIANLFKFEPGKEVVLTAIGQLRDNRHNVTREIRSENVIVVPQAKSNRPSLFDGPHFPAEYMKYATNPPIRISEPLPKPGDEIKTRLPHPPSQPPVAAASVKTAPHGDGAGNGRPATNKVIEPPTPIGQDHVANSPGTSRTKYFLAGTILALLITGGFLLKRR